MNPVIVVPLELLVEPMIKGAAEAFSDPVKDAEPDDTPPM